MARTIDNAAIMLPTPQITARGEIAATDYNNGGWEEIASVINTLEHQKRGVFVHSPDGVAWLSNTGKTARFWGKIVGKSGNTEKLLIKFFGIRREASSPSNFTVTASIVGGASLGPQEFYGGVDTTLTGQSWAMSGTLDIVHDAEYKILEVEITSRVNMTTSKLFSVCAYYQRTRSEAHAGEYSNGIVPLDTSRTDVDEYVNADLLHDCHNNERVIFEEHVSPICSTSRPEAALDPTSFGGMGWTGMAPEGVTKARIVIRGRQTDEDAGPYTWTITTNGEETLAISPTSGTMADYGPYDITVTPGRRIIFKLTSTTDTEIEGVHCWWEDADYDA